MNSPFELAPDPGVRLLSEQHLPSGSRVLDAGAGRGRNALYLASAGHDVVATEQDDEYLAEMNRAKDLGSTALKFTVAKDDICNPSVEQASFDAVFVTRVLQELPSKSHANTALNALTRITRPSGLHIITAYVGSLDEQETMSHRVIYNPNELRDSYRSRGWSILHAKTVLRPLTTIEGRPIIKSYDEIVAKKPDIAAALSQGMSDEYWRIADPERYDLIQSSRAA